METRPDVYECEVNGVENQPTWLPHEKGPLLDQYMAFSFRVCRVILVNLWAFFYSPSKFKGNHTPLNVIWNAKGFSMFL